VERRADASAFCDCGAERHGHLRGSACRYCAPRDQSPTLSIGLFRLPVEDQQKQTADYKPQQTSGAGVGAPLAGNEVERDAQEIEIITLKTQVDALK
jgi:hypothetical protein